MTRLLILVTALAAFSLVHPVKADRIVQDGPTAETVPDSGSTASMLGLALLGVAALRRKLNR
jgi:VPDSG-CTERM motif